MPGSKKETKNPKKGATVKNMEPKTTPTSKQPKGKPSPTPPMPKVLATVKVPDKLKEKLVIAHNQGLKAATTAQEPFLSAMQHMVTGFVDSSSELTDIPVNYRPILSKDFSELTITELANA